jgi:hypothetical protein
MLDMQFGTLKVKIKPEHLADFQNKLNTKPRKKALAKEKRSFPNSSTDLYSTAAYVSAYYRLNGLRGLSHFAELSQEPTTWPSGVDVEVEECEFA